VSDSVFVAWQDGSTRRWTTIAKLTRSSEGYEFVFTRGATKVTSSLLDLFQMEPGYRYRSADLLQIFRNRIPPRSRADFARLAAWLDVPVAADEFQLLSKFGLIPGSDSLLVYPAPQVVDGLFQLEFFLHGVRYMHPEAARMCDTVSSGERLYPMLDLQNPADSNAIVLRTDAHNVNLGFVPAFLAKDLRALLSNEVILSTSTFHVMRANEDAPTQLKVLCRFRARIPQSFNPFLSDEHAPLIKEPRFSANPPSGSSARTRPIRGMSL
jgi:hypothetical protein